MLLCVLAAGLVSANSFEAKPLESFLEFVTLVPAHQISLVATLTARITPSRSVSRRAYAAAYRSLSAEKRRKISQEYRRIVATLRNQGARPTQGAAQVTGAAPAIPTRKILNTATTQQTNAQRGAARQANGARKNWRRLSAAEKIQAQAAIRARIEKRRAARAARRAARPAVQAVAKPVARPSVGVSKIGLRPAQIVAPVCTPRAPRRKLTPEQKKARIAQWNALSSERRVRWYVARYFKTRRLNREARRGVLAWKQVPEATRVALKRCFPAKLVALANTPRGPARPTPRPAVTPRVGVAAQVGGN